MRDQPCKKDCPRRSAWCGATCPDWQKYVKERDAEYEERKRRFDFEGCKRVVIERAEHTLWLKRRK